MKGILVLLFAQCSTMAFAATDIRALSATDPLSKTASAIHTYLSDSNISGCGVTRVEALRVAENVKDWNVTSRELLQESFGDEYHPLHEPKIKVTKRFSARSIKVAVDAIMQSNDYNPKNAEIRQHTTRTVWALLRKLKIQSDSLVVRADVEVKSDCGDKQKVQSLLFINTETQKAIHIFTEQGFM